MGRLRIYEMAEVDIAVLSVKQPLNRPQQRRPEGLQTAKSGSCMVLRDQGPLTATLRLTTNDADEGTVDFDLTCTGIESDTVFRDGFAS